MMFNFLDEISTVGNVASFFTNNIFSKYYGKTLINCSMDLWLRRQLDVKESRFYEFWGVYKI